MDEDRRLLENGEGFTLRFFLWQEKGITLGNKEKPERSLNLDYVEKQGIKTAHRPTGGRAVYHHDNDSEITFSIACPRENPLFEDSIRAAFQWVSSLVVKALEAEGVNLHNHAIDQENYKGSNACFDSALKYEISVNGNKVFGSAQKRTGDRLLIQSTLLLNSSEETTKVLKTFQPLKGVCDFFPKVNRSKLIEKIESAYKEMTS